MEKDRDRCTTRGCADYSPVIGSYSPIRDKRNRPFKALTPRRQEKENFTSLPPSPKSPPKASSSAGQNKISSSAYIVPNSNDRFMDRERQEENKLPAIKTNAAKTDKNREEDIDDLEGPELSKKRAKSLLCNFIRKNEFGADLMFKSSFGNNLVTYLDYTASARPLKCIEAYVQRYVLPSYANTHTEMSHNAIQTTTFREEARDIIRKSVNASDDDCVIFTGSGSTSAVNKIVHTLKLEKMGKVIVFMGPYEHHSNILPWVHTPAQIIRIPQDKDGMVDIKNLASRLEQVTRSAKKSCSSLPFIIGAFSAASNVTGILTPTDPISSLIHRYNGIVLWDYACAAPYVTIDMNPTNTDPNCDDEPYKDAVFISPHKFVGGPGTPGLLIAKKWLFQHEVPHNTGGGTVLFVRRTKHVYVSNPEHREEGGTPAIIESIRCGLVFKLKDSIGSKYILKKEQAMYKKAINYLKNIEGLVLLGNPNAHRLPILPLLFYNHTTGRFLHHDFVAMIFNEVFGIQVRSGCACAGPYGMDLMGMSEEHAEKFEKLLTVSRKDDTKKPTDILLDREIIQFQHAIFKPGFVRLNLPYFMSDICLEFVLKAIRLVAIHGWSLLPQYKCDVEKGGWSHVCSKMTESRRHLDEVSFETGLMTVKKPAKSKSCRKSTSLSSSESSDSQESPSNTYTATLKRAEGLFADAMTGMYDCREDDTTGVADELLWFMTPKEAADKIHQRKGRGKMRPEQLPFFPGNLAAQLGICPIGHMARGNMDKHFPLEYHTYRDA